MANNFTDETIGKKSNEVATKIEPKMLPSRFRERSLFSQRLYLLLIVLAYSVAIGFMTFTLLSGLAQDMFKTYGDNKNILVFSLVISLVTLFTGGLSPMFTRNRKFLYTGWEFVLLIISPIVFIAAYSYITISFDFASPKKLLFFVGMISLVANGLPVLLNLIKTIVNFKKYKTSLIKASYLLPGNLVVAMANLVMWMFLKENGGMVDFSSKVALASAGTLLLGWLLIMIGIFISLRWDIRGAKPIWAPVRYSSALPILVTYSAMFVIGLRFMGFGLSLPILISLVADSVIVILFVVFIIMRGGIKNLIKTNPIYNSIILRTYVILVAIIGLVSIILLKQMSNVKDFGPPSFAILGITSFFVIIGVLLAHFSKLITYIKFYNLMIIGAFLTLMLIILIVLSLIVLKNSEIILAIISSQIVSLFLVFAIITEVISLAIDILVILTKISSKSRVINKQRAAIEEAAKVQKGDA